MKKKAHSSNLSFLDVLFGALGAVLILFIIMLSMSGAPPRPRSPVKRSFVWDFKLPNENPINVQVFSVSGEVGDNGELSPKSDLKNAFAWTNLTSINTNSSVKEICPVGTLRINRKTVFEDPVNKSTLNVSIEIDLDDDKWKSGFCLLIKLTDEYYSNSDIPELASFTVNPGMEPALSINSPKGSWFLCKFSLKPVKEGERGLMPSILFFRVVNEQEVAQ